MSAAPPLAYFGGKTRLARWIVQQFPEHTHYVEPFAGSLAVLLAKRPSVMETVNDLDGELMTFWRVLRDQSADLERVCALTPHSRAEHEAAYQRDDDPTDLEIARRVWVQLTQGRGGIRTSTGWRHYVDPAGSSTSMPGYLDGYVDRLAAAAQRLRDVSLESRPALDLIAKYGKSSEVLLYVDPPYLGSTRSSGGYVHEMRGEAQHRDLAAALRECKSAIVLSGYASPLYADLYEGWHVASTPTNTGQGGTWSERTEVLWSNRLPQPDLFGGVA